MTTATAPAPPRTLSDLEQLVARGHQAIIEAAEALAEINERRLYREAGFETFASYCRARWDFSSSRAYQLIDFAHVRRDIPAATEPEARRIAPALRRDPEGTKRRYENLAGVVGEERAAKELARSPRPTNGLLKRRAATNPEERAEALTKAAHAQEQYQWWKQERKDLVGAAFDLGCTLREIADATGSSIGNVSKLVGNRGR